MAELTGSSEQIRVSSLAKTVLNRSLTESEEEAVYRAHLVGLNQPGLKEGGARPGNFTFGQIRKKRDILSAAGFSAEDIRTLMKKKVVGVDLDLMRLMIALDPKDIATRRAYADILLEMDTPESKARANFIHTSLSLNSRLTAADRRRYLGEQAAGREAVDQQLAQIAPDGASWTWKDGFLETITLRVSDTNLRDPLYQRRLENFLLGEGRTASVKFVLTSNVAEVEEPFLRQLIRFAYENEHPGVVDALIPFSPPLSYLSQPVGNNLPLSGPTLNRSYLKMLANEAFLSDTSGVNYARIALAIFQPKAEYEFSSKVYESRGTLKKPYQRSESFKNLVLEGIEKDPSKFPFWKKVIEVLPQKPGEPDHRAIDPFTLQIVSDLEERSGEQAAKKSPWTSPENADRFAYLVTLAMVDAGLGKSPRGIDPSKYQSPRSAPKDYVEAQAKAIGVALAGDDVDSLVKLAPYLRPIDEFMSPNRHWHEHLGSGFSFVNWLNGRLTPVSFRKAMEKDVPKDARATATLTTVLSNHMLTEKDFELMGVVEGSLRSLEPVDIGFQTGLSALQQIANNRGHAKQVPAIQSLGRLARAGNVPAKEALRKLRTEPIWNSLSNEVKTKINAVVNANP